MQAKEKLKVPDLDDASLLKIFIGLRDRRAQRKAAYEADDATDKEKQNGIEVEFLRRFNERGIDNVSSREHGTAYRSTRSSVTVDDWEIFPYDYEAALYAFSNKEKLNKIIKEKHVYEPKVNQK